jgi:fructose-bisphosphate aldolase class II
MDLVPIAELLSKALKNSCAVGGFNVFNLEMLDPILRAAESEHTPVVVQVYAGDLKNVDGQYIAEMTRIAAERLSVPIALELDHGTSYDLAMDCIEWGFSSLMIDLSRSSFEENIKDTRRTVQEAHRNGVSVEAELGQIFSGRDDVEVQKSALTDIGLAVQYVAETGVDALAVSIGTAHGSYSYGPEIEFDLLSTLIGSVNIPIVIHGGSFIPDLDVLRMIELGVAKINIGTELLLAFYHGLSETIDNGKDESIARTVLEHAKTSVERVTREKIRLFNANGR